MMKTGHTNRATHCFYWSREADLNRRPTDYEAVDNQAVDWGYGWGKPIQKCKRGHEIS